MSKKDYIAIADAIRTVLESPMPKETRVQTIQRLAGYIAGVFARDRSRFDRLRFFAACGIVERV